MKKLAALVVLMASAAAIVVMVRFAPRAPWIAPLVAPGPLTVGHAQLADRCAACHEPAVGVTAERCVTCHAASTDLLARQPTAFHAAVDECAPCHVEHQRDAARGTRMDHAALGRIGVRAMARAAAHDPEAAAEQRALATWFHVRGPGDVDADAARAALDCAACHDRDDRHGRRFGLDCSPCHTTETWAIAGYRHPSPRSRECVQCHAAPPSHYMEHFAMVSQRAAGKPHARVEDCFECHETTAWNDIAGVGLYDHH